MTKQNAIFTNMFNNATPKFPFLMSSKVSKLNVENVLNPPQNPITMKYLRKWVFSILEENR